MKHYKIDMDVLLRNCEKYGVKVEEKTEKASVTMNGNPFDVEEIINSVFRELSSNYVGISSDSSQAMMPDLNIEQEVQPRYQSNYREQIIAA